MWTRGRDTDQPGRFAYELFSSTGAPVHRRGGFATSQDADRAAERAQRQQMVAEAMDAAGYGPLEDEVEMSIDEILAELWDEE